MKLRLRALLTILTVFSAQSLFSVNYDSYYSALPDNGIRELASAAESFEQHYFKNMNYIIHLQTPGFVRKNVTNVREYKPKKYSHLVRPVEHRRWLDGQPVETGRMLDFAVNTPGGTANKAFFTVQLPQGVMAYTRDGRFRVDHSNRLVTVSGHFPVLGENGFIELSQDYDLSVSRAGMIYNYDSPVDRLKITVFKSFEDMKHLQAFNNVFFILEEEVDVDDRIGQYQVQQGFLIQSNTFNAYDTFYTQNAYAYTTKSLYKLIDVNRTIYTATIDP